MEFSMAGILEWLLAGSPPGDLPDQGIEPTSLVSPALAGRFFTSEPPGKYILNPEKMFIDWKRCKTSESSRLEDFAYTWSCRFCCCFMFILLWMAFWTFLLITSQSLGILVGNHLSITPNPLPSWLWPLKSRATRDNLDTDNGYPKLTQSCLLCPLSHFNRDFSLVLNSLLQTIDLSKAVCLFLWKCHSQLSWHCGQPLGSVFPQAPMSTGCPLHVCRKKQG